MTLYCLVFLQCQSLMFGYNLKVKSDSSIPLTHSLILFSISVVSTYWCSNGCFDVFNTLHYHLPTHSTGRYAIWHQILWRNLNLLMALQLQVETSRAWNIKSLAYWITGYLAWKDLSQPTDYIVNNTNTHTHIKTSGVLCWHKVIRGQWVRGDLAHTLSNESRKDRTMLRSETDKCTPHWADRQDHVGMSQHYVNPQAAVCT